MNIFSRTRAVNTAHVDEAFAAAVEVIPLVKKVTGVDVAAWTTLFGAPVGMVSWSSRFDSQAAMGEAMEKLLVDPGYLRFLRMSEQFFSGPAEDTLVEIVAAVGTPKPSSYVSVISAQCAPGKIAEAMAWGVDVMNYAAKLTGTSPMMGRGLYGPFATIGWINNVESLAEFDNWEKALSQDPTYVERLDQGGEFFLAGSATTRLMRRLG